MQVQEKYMLRCFELAALGLGAVQTNPLVGAVVVHNDNIIGEGYHQKYGEAHAEVNAIQQVIQNFPNAKALLAQSTLYVSLEPCAHQGKTPPCANLIIAHQIPKVVISNVDPFEKVAGKGIQLLKNAGVDVVTGVLEKEGKWLNRRFFCRVEKQRPYIILKWAETQNGYFAPKNQTQSWISSPICKNLVHQWRSEEAAVLVGFKTALIDNPRLNVRESFGKSPIRVLIDSKLNLPKTHHLLDSSQKTLIFNTIKTHIEGQNFQIEIPEHEYYFYEKLVYQLYLNDISSVIIEGGNAILQAFIEKGLWDEARVFSSKKVIWNEGVLAPTLSDHTSKSVTDLGEEYLIFYQK